MTGLVRNLMLSILAIGVLHAAVYYEQAIARDARIATLESRLSRARLEALSARLNPHFLFNSINAIAELVHKDPRSADAMLVGLAAMLRSSLLHDPSQEVELHSELDLVAHYVALQQVRLGDRLRMKTEVDPNTLDAFVPALLLQPLVENAFVHGISRRLEPGRIVLQVWRAAARLRIRLENDGVLNPGASNGNGMGLQNTRDRLACLYENDYSLEIETTPSGNTTVLLDLPFKTSAVLAPALPKRAPVVCMAEAA